jgi:O-antigen chain-terminating methyltransferase
MSLAEDQLKKRIKEEIASLQEEELGSKYIDLLRTEDRDSDPVADPIEAQILNELAADDAERQAPCYRFQPEYEEPEPGVHASYLLSLHDHEFVCAAYRYILHREPDPEGLEHYLSKLRSGSMDKILILGSLRYFKEGRERGVLIPGLMPRYLAARLLRLPVLGHLLRSVLVLLNLPGMYRHLLRVEANQMAMHSELKAQLDKSFTMLQRQDRAEQRSLGVIAAQLSRIGELESTVLSLERDLEINSAAMVNATRPLREGVKSLRESVAAVRQQMLDQHHLEEVLRTISTDVSTLRAGVTPPDPVMKSELSTLYQRFEDRFRGTREEIKERLQVHLNCIRSDLPEDSADVTLIDLGCGRGEWLELLAEKPWEAIGVDANPDQVSRCRALGLDVYLEDALEHLKNRPDNSVDVITAFHIVEHIPFSELVALLNQCHRVLKLGGRLVLETPNPENLIVGANTFYLDPTHVHPLPPPLLSFTVEECGFIQVAVTRLHPYPGEDRLEATVNSARLDDLLFGCQDYSVTGRKE